MSRVLIVDDDAVFRRGLARMFSNECEVTQASDAEQAIEAIANAVPDLVICDFRLPDTDGLGVLAHLKQRGARSPFILLTAYGSSELFEKAKAQGANEVLEKPVELKDFKRQCELILSGAQS